MADGFMKKNPGPTRAKDNIETAGRRWDCREIDQGLTQRLIDGALPNLVGDKSTESLPSTSAVRSGFLPVAVTRHYRNIDPDQRAHITNQFAIGA